MFHCKYCKSYLEVSTEQYLFYEGDVEFTLKTGALHPLTSTWPVQQRSPRPTASPCCNLPLDLQQDTVPWHKKQTAFEHPGKAFGCEGRAPTCSAWREAQNYYWLQRHWDSAPGWKLASTLIELKEGDSLQRTATSWAIGWDLYWAQS